MAQQAPSGESTTTVPLSKEAQIEQERMQVVETLLNQLFDREDATIRVIFNCLYDVGVINLLQQRFPSLPAKGLVRSAAQFPKPFVKPMAMKWFKKNCPPLIVKWMYGQVKYRTAPKERKKVPEPAPTTTTVSVNAEVVQPNIQAKLDAYNREILKLHSQVRTLTVLLVSVTCTLGGGFAWSLWKDQAEQVQPVHSVRAIVLDAVHPPSLQAVEPTNSN
ncbi:MAG TPA: hypothetical protein V6C78_05430 [Crinalium sp.]|jgi:hypothetical protein